MERVSFVTRYLQLYKLFSNFIWIFNFETTYRKCCILLWWALPWTFLQTESASLDDGAYGAAAAGVGSVRRLLLLWDCHRRVRHHSTGDFTLKLTRNILISIHFRVYALFKEVRKCYTFKFHETDIEKKKCLVCGLQILWLFSLFQ